MLEFLLPKIRLVFCLRWKNLACPNDDRDKLYYVLNEMYPHIGHPQALISFTRTIAIKNPGRSTFFSCGKLSFYYQWMGKVILMTYG
jgi:hypothetical protein